MLALRSLLAILTITTNLFSTSFPSIIEEEAQKIKKADNQKTHPKILEFNKNSQNRPTKCQVCRIMVHEIELELNKTKNSKQKIRFSNSLDGRKKENLSYKTSELRLMDVLDMVCGNVDYYRVIAGPQFPYLRNVKSMYRIELEKAMKESGVGLTLDAPPQTVDDPTAEIKRLHFECVQMVEEHEEEILEWFKTNQDIPPIDYICRERVLQHGTKDCLNATTESPEWGSQIVKTTTDQGIYNLLKHSRSEL